MFDFSGQSSIGKCHLRGPKIYIAGQSQGTFVIFTMLSVLPEYNTRTSLRVLLALFRTVNYLYSQAIEGIIHFAVDTNKEIVGDVFRLSLVSLLEDIEIHHHFNQGRQEVVKKNISFFNLHTQGDLTLRRVCYLVVAYITVLYIIIFHIDGFILSYVTFVVKEYSTKDNKLEVQIRSWYVPL